jgi:hypothetical protein
MRVGGVGGWEQQLPAGQDQPAVTQQLAVGHPAAVVGGEDLLPAVAVAKLTFGDPPQRIALHHHIHPALAGQAFWILNRGRRRRWRLLQLASRTRTLSGDTRGGVDRAQQLLGAVPARRAINGADHRRGTGQGHGRGDRVRGRRQQADPNRRIDQGPQRRQGDQIAERQQPHRPDNPPPGGRHRHHPQHRHQYGVAPQRPGEQAKGGQQRFHGQVLLAQPIGHPPPGRQPTDRWRAGRRHQQHREASQAGDQASRGQGPAAPTGAGHWAITVWLSATSRVVVAVRASGASGTQGPPPVRQRTAKENRQRTVTAGRAAW